MSVPGSGGGGDDPPDHLVQALLIDGEGPGDRRPHRDLDGDDDLVAERLDDPAEAAERDVAAARLGFLTRSMASRICFSTVSTSRSRQARRLGAVLRSAP